MTQLKIVVISHASIKAVNRSVYRWLSKDVDSLSIIVPASVRLASKRTVYADPHQEGDPDVIMLELRGSNPRTYTYQGLISCLDEIKPNVVLLENDPASRLGLQLSHWTKKHGMFLICQTYENFDRDITSTVKTQGWKKLPMNILVNGLNKFMASRVNALLVVNKESERIFKGHGYKNVVRIPLGYDDVIFYKDEGSRKVYRDKLNVGENTVLVAYFGRMVPQKGVDLLISALYKMPAIDYRLLLDHAHDNHGAYVSQINDLIQAYGLADKIIYFDADHIEIANYMRAADIMVAPSITTTTFKEQYGRAVQEAMACGCVTLVSDSGHLQDLVEEKSLIFREGDVDALKKTLLRLMSDKKKRDAYSLVLQERANNNFTVKIQAQKIMALVKKLYGIKF